MNNKIIALTVIVFVAALSSSILLFQYLNTGANNANQTETLEITDSAVWYQNTWSYAQAALIVVNDGKTDAVLERITVRGVECNWNDVYYWKAEIGSVSNVLKQSSNELSGASVEIVVDGKKRLFHQATGPLLLDHFQLVTLYIKNPGNISSQDIPGKVTIAIFTERDVYLKETTVSAQFAFMATEDLRITSMTFSGDTITVVANNTGTAPITINEFWVNGAKQTYTPQTVQANSGFVAKVDYAWTAGANYQVKLVSSKGNTFMYTAVAPA